MLMLQAMRHVCSLFEVNGGMMKQVCVGNSVGPAAASLRATGSSLQSQACTDYFDKASPARLAVRQHLCAPYSMPIAAFIHDSSVVPGVTPKLLGVKVGLE